jgi:hypothetical protein
MFGIMTAAPYHRHDGQKDEFRTALVEIAA